MKIELRYPIASPWLIPGQGDPLAASLVKRCDGRHTLRQVCGQPGIGRQAAERAVGMAERLGVIALATAEMRFLNAFCADEWGGLLFEGAKAAGISPTAHLATLKTHYRELSAYLGRTPKEIFRLFQASFAREAPGNLDRPSKDAGGLARAIRRRYESEAYLVRRHLIHFHTLTTSLVFSRAAARIRLITGRGGPLRLLDAGCGEGVWMRQAFDRAGGSARVYGLDIGGNALRFGRFVDKRRGTRCGEFLRGDAGCLPFRAGAFDAVCCFEVLEHLPATGPALRAFHRVLAPGGILLLTWSSGANLMSGHLSPASPGEVREALVAGRFRVERLEVLPEAQTTYVEARRLRPAKGRSGSRR